jgi:two-component system NtrC family sensor kinase
MRVVPKLTLAFILCTTAVLSMNGLLRVQREVAVFEQDRVRDHRVMGRALGEAIAAVWRSDGEESALSVLSHVNVPQAHVRVRWVWLDEIASDKRAPLDVAALNATAEGTPVSTVWIDPSGADFRVTYVRLDVGVPRAGALQLAESLESQHRFEKRTILDTVLATASLSIAAACLSMLLGVWIVGRPMRSLMEKARRTGQGDFSSPLHLRQNDELAELAVEMNTMCERLVDANQRIHAETRARIDAIEQLRHADRLMTVGKLASGIAHELGTPLNVVEARATMIASGETSREETLDYARIIVDAAGRMTRIIRQLLEFARRKGPQKSAQRIAPLIRRTLELLRPLGAKKRITLSLDGEETKLVDVDASQFEQVVTNLVVNAIQSMTEPGAVEVHITEERASPPADVVHGNVPSAKAEYACVRIVDQGVGIPADHLAHIFEPFFTTKDVGEGTGLGLSVAYGIVRDHGGWIDVKSEVDKGTEFRVFLPLEPGESSQDGRGAP